MKRVLFLCTGNACRSQMCEGWARHLLGDRVDAYSAGVVPHGVDARAVEVMKEAGVDITHHSSKHVDELRDISFDLIVTVCDNAAAACPVFPGTVQTLHHGFDDPPLLSKGAQSEQQALEYYRRVRDEIRAFIATLPKHLEN